MRAATLILIGLVLLNPLFAPTARAADWSVVVNGRSMHLDAAKDWNESNWGLGFEREFDSDRRWVKVALGSGFRDSQDELSYMAGGGIKRRFRIPAVANGFYVDVGAVGFMMTRHDVNNNRPFPAILPAITVGSRHLALNISYVSSAMADYATNVGQADPGMDGIVFLQLKLDARLFTMGGGRRLGFAAAGD